MWEAVPLLLSTAAGSDPAPLRKAALVSLMAFDHADIGPWAAALLPKTSGETRTAVLALLASRETWTRNLLRAIERGSVTADTVPQDIIERVRAHSDPEVARLAGKVFPAAQSSGTG